MRTAMYDNCFWFWLLNPGLIIYSLKITDITLVELVYVGDRVASGRVVFEQHVHSRLIVVGCFLFQRVVTCEFLDIPYV